MIMWVVMELHSMKTRMFCSREELQASRMINEATMLRGFRNRKEAGRLLARKLAAYAGRTDVVVLALPRGGVPVAFEVARALHAPLDLVIVRKLGVPGQEELAMGAIATGGFQVLNHPVVRSLGLSKEEIESVAARERVELERREHLYRGGRPSPEIHGRTVILIDDGIATGTTMKVAITALKQRQPSRIVVAIPVAPSSTCGEMRGEGAEIVCLLSPEDFIAIGVWYADFAQVPDQEVCDLLERAHRETHSAAEVDRYAERTR
jgi:predicted phosphoribosyltransferase